MTSQHNLLEATIGVLETLVGEGTTHLPFKRAINPTSPTVEPMVPKPIPVAVVANLSPSPITPLKAADLKAPENDSLTLITTEVAACKRCRLCEKRTNTVVARGNPKAELMFIGEGPGQDEDLQGQPFVGKAGQLLDKIIGAMGYERDEVYIANVVKCRPPGNRNPEPDEVAKCLPYLLRQIAQVKPKVICTLGSVALQAVTGTSDKVTARRGNFIDYQGTPLMPTFHPAYLLRNPGAKKEVWEDVQKILVHLGRKPQGKK